MAEETMLVKVVDRTSRVGVYIQGNTPTWNALLGETVEIQPETAEFMDRDRVRVRVKAKALTGQKAGVEFTPLTSMLVLTPEQEATIRRCARKNAADRTPTAAPGQTTSSV